MRLLPWAAALWTLSQAAEAKTFFAIPADYEKINSPPPEVVVANPFPKIKGQQINGVKFSFDGSWYEFECSTEDRGGSRKTCGKPLPVQPGAHVFYAVLCTESNCGGFGKA